MSRASKPTAATRSASPGSGASDPELSVSSSNTAPPSSRPRSGAASASASSARPFSSSNLSASIANARFKTFQVQYEILSKNPILGAIATEIPWKNLLDLFLLKFYAVGDVLWHQDEQPHEMVFVLCGGFLARHIKLSAEPAAANQSYAGAPQPIKALGTILAEKMVKPGGSLAAYAVHANACMAYTVVTAKFKSIALSLSTGKYKSILRQLSPELKQLVEHLLYETETKLLSTLKMPLIAPPKDKDARHQHNQHSTQEKQHSSRSPRKHHASSSRNLHRAASTPALAGVSSLSANGSSMNLDVMASWASLQIVKPVEYEVNSSLLILHQPADSSSSSSSSASTASHSLAPKRLMSSGSLLHSSSAARLAAKKHTQRRLQSIKLPNPVEAFPPQPKTAADLMDQAMLAAFGSASDQQRASHLDVVPKVHVGRLLKPLRKPNMFSDSADAVASNGSSSSKDKRRSHTVVQEQRCGQRVLVADRAEPFRDAW